MTLNLLLMVLVLIGPAVSPVESQAVQIAQADFEAGKYSQAVQRLTSALDSAPLDSAGNYWLARSYYEQHDYDKAITFLEQAVRLSSQNAEYQRWLGRAYGAKAEESHSFFLARKVKQAFEAAVNLAPRNIEARRDLMQYLVEAPWIVGGDKEKARKEIESIARLDPVEGRLAQAAYLSSDKKWKEATTEYLAVVDQRPARIEPYMEAAQFFAERKDAANLDRALSRALALNSRDSRLDFYQAVSFILHRTDGPKAEELLKNYVANVPQRSDYPSHNEALGWLRMLR